MDNCLSPYLAKALHALSEPDGNFVSHLCEVFERRNIADDEWLPRLAREGDWVVISGDMRIFKARHLRQVWLDSRLTTFFLSKGWMNIPVEEQAWKLVRLWPPIVTQAGLAARGSGFEVPMQFATGFKPLRA